jgi:gluconolactonase
MSAVRARHRPPALPDAQDFRARHFPPGVEDTRDKPPEWRDDIREHEMTGTGQGKATGENSGEGGWRQSARYPDESIEVLDPAFAKYKLSLAAVERLATGMRWSEGPVWFGDGRYLLWSDIPNNRIMRFDEATGAVAPYRAPSNNANGHTRDRQGRLVSCEHLTRRVTRTEYDGSITVLADSFDGKRLNSPNDVVVKSDGSIWFTDPIFGILGFYEGEKAEPELPQNVYRLDPATGKITVVAEGVRGPNGLAFSPDERRFYLVESRGEPHRLILGYDVVDGGKALANKATFIDCGPQGTPDGFRVDIDGNLWCGWGMTPELDGVRIFSPEGKAIGHIHLPERCANLCFGGRHRNRLFMAASQSLYAVYVNTQGVAGG